MLVSLLSILPASSHDSMDTQCLRTPFIIGAFGHCTSDWLHLFTVNFALPFPSLYKCPSSYNGTGTRGPVRPSPSHADGSLKHCTCCAEDTHHLRAMYHGYLYNGLGRMVYHSHSQGGSALSPAAIISPERARQQVVTLAKEVSCPTTSSQEVVSCLRQKPAGILNDAQTKLLAVSGPFHYWGPVVDGQYLRESPARALQRSPRGKVDLLIGSSQDDGLINRAKAVKQFEESQGRTSSKTAFYQALQNSLGGEDSDPRIQAAAVWYYSLEHSTDDYATFSRALENATRDYFITCPVIDMASLWSQTARGNVFMYHAPENYGHGSLNLLTDVQYAFGLPFYPAYKGQFSLEEKSLSLKIMQYFSNFIRSGNPNYPYEFSRKAPAFAAPWPDFVPRASGGNYKEFSALLPNRQGLKKADCSFWSKYIQSLKASADGATSGQSAGSEEEELATDSELREDLLSLQDPGSKSYSK
ncbi:Thyroglobulin [Tupaia chinensis]|uniref:Thyroglobulin n=1 Tax=Tupaia chinensis TaxID=246437 RepID=L9K3P6_TUPCH|nr:Thyroglobulin [Tupaia chinensis]